MSERDTETPPSLDIDWLKTAAGALAAVTAAILLSTLGAVGTLIGAAVGSVAATVGSALYGQGLARSKYAVLKAQETAMLKVGIAQAEVRRAGRRDGEGEQEAHLELADERLGEAKKKLDEAVHEPTQPQWRERFVLLPWRRIALVAASTFVVVVLAITAFETLTGESVSQRTGGSDKQSTTLGGVTGNSGGNSKPDKPQQSDQPTELQTPSESPSETPSETPTETPTPTPHPDPDPDPDADGRADPYADPHAVGLAAPVADPDSVSPRTARTCVHCAA